MTARLDAASGAKEDEELEFWLDLRRVQVFDPESGENLTAEANTAGENGEVPTRAAEPPAGEET